MSKYDNPCFDDCRKWIQKKRERGASWQNLQLACKHSEEELNAFTYMAACGAEGVTRILNSSSVMFFRSNIVFIPFFILEQKFCIPTERSLAAMRQHFQVFSNPP